MFRVNLDHSSKIAKIRIVHIKLKIKIQIYLLDCTIYLEKKKKKRLFLYNFSSHFFQHLNWHTKEGHLQESPNH